MADFVTPRDLSDELGVSQRKIRDYLRKKYGVLASANEVRWELGTDRAADVREHFRGAS